MEEQEGGERPIREEIYARLNQLEEEDNLDYDGDKKNFDGSSDEEELLTLGELSVGTTNKTLSISVNVVRTFLHYKINSERY